MVESWWSANELEIFIGAVVLGVCALVLSIDGLVRFAKARRKGK